MVSKLRSICITFMLCGWMQVVWPSCNPGTPPPYISGYVAFTFLNNSGLVPPSNMFVTFLASQPNPPATIPISYFMQFNLVSGVWIGSFVQVNGFAIGGVPISSLNYAYPISQFATGSAPYTVYLPTAKPLSDVTTTITQQLFVAIDYPISMNITEPSPGAFQVAAPGAFDKTDGNYYHVYDSSILFSLDPTTTGINMQSNYTSFFGLPISAAVSWNGPYNTLLLGADFSRNTAFQNYHNSVLAIGISNPPAALQWAKLPVTFTSASGGGSTDLRLASSLSAFSLGFATDYLYNPTYGLNWENTVFTPVAPYPLYLDVSTLGPGYTTYKLTSVTPALQFSPFGGSLGSTVTTSNLPIQSQAFINGASDPTGFNVTGGSDSAVAPTICQLLSTGFISGLFPQTTFTSTAPFGTIYLAQQNAAGAFYTDNANLPSGGPWYDLYSQTLHTLAGTTSPPYIDFLAVPADSLMGFFSGTTIPINNNTRPSVFINLSDMTGTILPNFADNTTYNITISPGAGVTVLYGSTTIVGASSQDFNNVSLPIQLQITYTAGSHSNPNLTYNTQIYLNTNYTVVYPQPPASVGITPPGTRWVIGMGAPP